MEAVDGVIKELDAWQADLVVFNKIDNLPTRDMVGSYTSVFPGASRYQRGRAKESISSSRLLQDALASWRLRSSFRIPANESALIAEIHRVGHVSNSATKEMMP